MEISTLLNKVTDVRGNYAEKSSKILYRNEVSHFVDPVLQTVVGEAKERLKKIDKSINVPATSTENYKYKLYIEGNSSEHHIRWVGYCVHHCKDLVKQLQNFLDRLNIKEVSQQGRELPNHRKKFMKLHGCTSLKQENMRLQQKPEYRQPNNDKLSQKTIDFKEINRMFCLIQRDIPRISIKKHVHDLLSRLMETNELREKAIVGGAMLDNPASQDNIKDSTSIVIKLPEKVIKELGKESEETYNTLREQRMMQKGNTEKVKHLQKKKE